MELVIFLVLCVVVLVLLLVAIVFCRSARKEQTGRLDSTKFLDSRVDSPTPSEQDASRWTLPQQPQCQQLRHMQQLWQMQELQLQMQQMQQQIQHFQLRNSTTTIQQQLFPMNPSNSPEQAIRPAGGGGAALRWSSFNTAVVEVSRADAANLFAKLIKFRLLETEVTLTRKISTGSFGVVWLAHYHGKPVAVKMMINEQAEDTQRFVKEILIVARINHPRIVTFLGCIWTQPADLGAVTEFMTGGDLSSVLKDKLIELRWPKEKVSIAIDIAEALQYLHALTPKLIHRDLKSRNVLLDAHLNAKLSDFGLSRNRTYEESLTAGVGTVRWTAPEVMLGENYSEQADIYSFGVVLSELDTREIPFEESTSGDTDFNMSILIKVAKGELRPAFSSGVPPCIDQIAHACLQFDPALRPKAAQVVAMLNMAKTELTQLPEMKLGSLSVAIGERASSVKTSD